MGQSQTVDHLAGSLMVTWGVPAGSGGGGAGGSEYFAGSNEHHPTGKPSGEPFTPQPLKETQRLDHRTAFTFCPASIVGTCIGETLKA